MLPRYLFPPLFSRLHLRLINTDEDKTIPPPTDDGIQEQAASDIYFLCPCLSLSLSVSVFLSLRFCLSLSLFLSRSLSLYLGLSLSPSPERSESYVYNLHALPLISCTQSLIASHTDETTLRLNIREQPCSLSVSVSLSLSLFLSPSRPHARAGSGFQSTLRSSRYLRGFQTDSHSSSFSQSER